MEPIAAVNLSLESQLRFRIDFGLAGGPTITTDAMPPLGGGQGPDSERLLVAAVANCLSASLAFSLRKYRNPEIAMRTQAEGRLTHNDQGRLRMHGIAVDIHLGAPADSIRLLERALAQFEDFCTVTQSIRAAFPVVARVFDSDGKLLTGD
ncbi:MAG: OsmC family protein [Proteobacteria bacterium]|nr:OsmC family protein [Pseudomonadota bacterium]